MTYKVGDIFLTRNIGGEELYNTSPGYFNHAAIYIGNNLVVEAQVEFGVISVKLDTFKERYPAYVVLRYPKEEVGIKAAERAKSLLGMSYRKIASIFNFLRVDYRGENCVSVVRKAYISGLLIDPIWRFPDHIYYDLRFNEVDRKWDEKWQPPPRGLIDEIVR